MIVDGQDYAAVAAPLHGNAFDKTSGVVTLASVSDAMEPVSAVGRQADRASACWRSLVLLGAVMLTALRFIKPLDKIELGVAEIINGNIDYQFRPVGPDFEGLSNGLNVMLARLLGREEPNEDEPEEEQDETVALAIGSDAGRRGARARARRPAPRRTRWARRASRSTTRASSTNTSRRCAARASRPRGSPSRRSPPSSA